MDSLAELPFPRVFAMKETAIGILVQLLRKAPLLTGGKLQALGHNNLDASLLQKGQPCVPYFWPVGDTRDERPHRSIHTF
jgi:hypothetical protein